LLSAGWRRLRNLLLSALKKITSRLLNRYGYTITKAGLGFIDAKSFTSAARKKGLSVSEYWESLRDDPRKVGRPDLIIRKLQAVGILDSVSTVCEIGTGTGRYLERVIGLAQPETYEVYETDRGWVEFLKSEYGGLNGCTLICHPADGNTLRYARADEVIE